LKDEESKVDKSLQNNSFDDFKESEDLNE